MDGNNTWKLVVIALGTLAALWALAPTFLLVDDATVEVEAKAAAEPNVQAWFTTEDGAPSEATVAAAESRLDAAGVGVDGVGVKDDLLVVFLSTGTRKEDVAAALLDASGTRVVGIDALGIDPARLEGVDDVDALLDSAVAAATLAAEVPSLEVGTVQASAGDDGATITLGNVPQEGVLAVAVGDTVVGWMRDAAPGAAVPLHTVEGADVSTIGRSALPQALTRYDAGPAQVTPEVADDGVATPVAWWASMLPNTKLNLGLDLQGGIDLTLQVDQEAAVISSVNRDRRQLLDRAAEEGLTVDVRRDRTRFALRATSTMEFAALKTWIDEQLGGLYTYVTTEELEGRTWHTWEMAERQVNELMEQAVEQNLETLRKRVDATGVKEPSIVKLGGGRINVQLPGVSGSQQATEAIGTQATLEFRMVDEDANEMAVRDAVRKAELELPGDQFQDIELLNEWLRRRDLVDEGRIVMFRNESDDPEIKPSFADAVLLIEDIVLTGADVDNASVGFDQNNFPRVMMDFKPRGARVFCDVTTNNVGKRFAIILDGEIRSAPNIREPICGGSGSIEMGSSADAIDDANTLALVLRSGALTAPVDIGEVREIGSSLGADAIRQGEWGAIIGGTLTLLFMVLWYRGPGAIADVALALNVLLVFALLASIGATLTLPGIAGVALTIGMAVDANIIIYERIREELKLGVNARKAVDTGYQQGTSAIVDANVTTFIAGVVLYSFGTGPIKGFAVTLLIGIFTTLVTALFVTRTFMEMLTRNSASRLKL